ncbi:hypothetical protein Tco_1509607 [Tanacetum coccineum]
MSLGDSGSLDLPDTAAINPALEATFLPKFDMHLYRSSLTKTNVKWLTKCYGIPADLHPRVPPEGMTMDVLPADVIGLYAHHFQQGGLRVPFSSFLLKRAAPIAMPWRHHDSSVSDPIPKPDEYNASDVAKLREVVIPLRKPPPSILYIAGLSNVWKHADRAFSLKGFEWGGQYIFITMAEFLRLPDFHGCKVFASELLSPGSARVTHLTAPAERVEDIPPKTGDMMVAKLPCQKVLDDKERKKRKAEEKDAIHVQDEKVVKEKDGREGVRKKRRVRIVNPVQPTSKYVSSPTPLNHAKPLTTIAGEAHVTPPTFASRMDVLRDQTDEPVTPPVMNVGEFPTGGEDGQDGADAMLANEGHGDNEDCLLEMVEKPASDKIVPDAEAKSSSMDNSRQCRDMMSNLFTPADLEFFNEGVHHESVVKRSWKMLCQSAQQELAKAQSAYDENVLACDQLSKNYDGALIYEKSLQEKVEELEEEKREAEQLTYKQADRIKHLEGALKQSEVEAQQLRFDKEKYVVEAGQGEMVRRRIINQYLPTFVRRLHQSVEYNRSLGEAFSLAIGKGFIDGISIG